MPTNQPPHRSVNDFTGRPSRSMQLPSRGALVLIGLLIAIILSLAGFALYTNAQYQALKKNPSVASEDTNKAILSRLGKIMKLPDDETPQIAAVSDKSKLASDVFFKDADNGDYLIVYSKARRIIVFRDSKNQIINQGPFTINTAGKVKVGLVQASSSAAAVQTVQQQIKDKLGDTLGVIDIADTKAKGTYRKTQVVDLTGGQRTDQAKTIASAVGGEVITKMPEGEAIPQDTEVVVFVVQ